ncbi:MAG TPA: hypothetical protein VMY37_30835 [Thermoguttaceae bacterium]|nr:hypothetical protein [Thermoguttaceae bacterium]
MAFSPDGKLLACGGLRRDRPDDQGPRFPIQILDGEAGERTGSLAGHAAPLFSLQFSPSGRLLVSAAGDSTVSVWNVADGQRHPCQHIHRRTIHVPLLASSILHLTRERCQMTRTYAISRC